MYGFFSGGASAYGAGAAARLKPHRQASLKYKPARPAFDYERCAPSLHPTPNGTSRVKKDIREGR